MKFNWSFNHLGMMVTDRDEVLEYYQSIGLGVSVGPQPLLPFIAGEGEITFFRELDGDTVSHKYQTLTMDAKSLKSLLEPISRFISFQ